MCYTEGMENMFKLSRRKGSAKWQVRKRWPSDVSAILKGEFNASTGEEDRKLAQQRLPFISAEYERRVQEARDRLSAQPRGSLSDAEAHRMAADFYREALPRYVTSRQLDPIQHQELQALMHQRLKGAQAMLGRNEYGAVIGIARELMKRADITLPEESPSLEFLHRMLMRAFVSLHEAAAANLDGKADFVPSDAALLDAPADPGEQSEGRTLDALITAYEADKAPGWSGSTKKAKPAVFRLLRDVFPDRTVASITREDARDVVEVLRQLPTQIGKRKELAGLTVPQAVEKGRALKLQTISPKTINDGYLLHIASLFNWARREQWIASSPFEGLSVYDPVDDSERRDPFTIEQLNTLFASGPWTAPWSPDRDKPGRYWVPLLCLYHGLRNGEAAGLRVEDVGTDGDIPVIHIRPYDTRKLKTKDARATLALHPELIRLGFMRHVEARRDAGETLLFPEGAANSRGQIGAKLGERFSAHVKKLGLEGRKLGMHSFRHCFEDRLREAELPERTALALARRTEPGSSRIYGGGLSMRQKAEAVAKICYPGLHLSHLRDGQK